MPSQPSGAEPPFKDGAESFGAFYPKPYVLAVFADGETAARGADALRASGFAADDLVEAPGAEFVERAQGARSEQGPLTRLREQWSKLYTDGSAASHELVDLAGRGAAFVLAYAPEGAQSDRAAAVLRPLGPAVLRCYGTFTVPGLA